MKMRYLFLILAIVQSSAMLARAEAPPISVKVLNCLPGEAAVPEGTCAVSNVKDIEVEVTLDRKGHPALQSLAGTPVNPDAGNLPANYLVIKAIDDSNGNPIPIKAAQLGTGLTQGKDSIRVSLEILEEAAVRKTKIQAYVDQVRSQEADPEVLQNLTAKNEAVVSAMDKLYMENRLGTFRIMVEYVSTQAGAWTGRVSTPEAKLAVLNKGSFFDGLSEP